MAAARKYANRYSWHSRDSSLLSEGHQLEDIVQEVILKAISRQRKWDPQRGELLPWLYAQVRSEIDNLHSKLSHQREFPVAIPEGQDEIDDPVDHQKVAPAIDNVFSYSRSPSPEEAMLKKEYVEEKSKLIWAAIDNDPELERLIDVIIQTHSTKPKDLSISLEVPAAEVSRLLKKLRRRTG